MQKQLSQQLSKAIPPEEKRDLALALLQQTFQRTYIDQALATLQAPSVLETLVTDSRSPLREKALYYFEHTEKDKAGLLRENITRLLIHIGHPGDIDIYIHGVNTYYRQPVTDVAGNLRAVALVGLATANPELGHIYATKLLGEEDTAVLNCEPSMTALTILEQSKQFLLIYHFVLLRGQHFIFSRRGEVVGKAMESLGKEFPVSLYRMLAEMIIEIDEAVATIGIVNFIIDHSIDQLHDLIETVLNTTESFDLHQYTLIKMAASRDEILTNTLYRLAKIANQSQIRNFIEAIELTIKDEREEMLVFLKDRL